MAILSKDVGIDLGTSNVQVYIRGKGLVLSQPCLLALDEVHHTIVAVGTDAQLMLGRTPENVIVVRPMKAGVISDYDLAERMLHYFIHKVLGGFSFFRPRVVVSVPPAISDVERRSVMEATLDAGASDTRLIVTPLAAAIGAGMEINNARGNIVVDIGGGTTDIALISMNTPVLMESVRIAGDNIDKAIIGYMKKKHNILIGDRTAEKIKMQIGAATKEAAMGSMEVTGRNLLNGLPLTVYLTAEEVTEAIDETIRGITEAVHAILEQTPPELAADIYEYGITFTGGSAQLNGLMERMKSVTRVPCHLAEKPQQCVALGMGKALENLELYGELIQDYRRPVRYDFKRM